MPYDVSQIVPLGLATAAARRVNLNTGTPEQIAALPMVGATLATALIAARPFRTWDDLARVDGFYLALLEDLRRAGAEIE